MGQVGNGANAVNRSPHNGSDKEQEEAAKRSRHGRFSKRKGRRFQTRTADLLSVWWTGEKGHFRSTPASGGLDKKSAPGDVIPKGGCPHGEDFPFVIECKKRAKINFLSIFEERCEIAEWWEQVRKDSEISEKIPILVISSNENRGQMYVIYRPVTIILAKGHPVKCLDEYAPGLVIPSHLIDRKAALKMRPFVLMTWDIFSKAFQPKFDGNTIQEGSGDIRPS